MLSSRPYLLRGLYEWIVDNGMTPQVLVDGANTDVNVPDAARSGEKLVLNIAPAAVRDLEIDNEYVSCVARFGGVSHAVVVPVEAVLAIYARENGQGMMFPELESDAAGEAGSDSGDSTGDETGEDRDSGRRGRPNLKVIK